MTSDSLNPQAGEGSYRHDGYSGISLQEQSKAEALELLRIVDANPEMLLEAKSLIRIIRGLVG